jgi:hypothetical protein
VDTVFGGSAGKIRLWAEENKAAFGISYSLVQAMVFPSNRISGCIIDVEDSAPQCAIEEQKTDAEDQPPADSEPL